MKTIAKLYLKTFLFMGLPLGIILIAMKSTNAIGSELDYVKITLQTVFFSAITAAIFVAFHKYGLKRKGAKDNNLSVNQKQLFISNLNKQDLLKKLKQDSVLRKMRLRETRTSLLLSSGISWKSWGENIKIIIRSISDNKFEYQVSSEPKLRTTLIDNGKNLENINRIKKLLNVA